MKSNTTIYVIVLVWILSGFIICVGLYQLFLQNVKLMTVVSSSMENTLFEGDKVVVLKKLNNRIFKIRRNDLLVFRRPASGNESNPLIKRCLGLPGDTIEFDANEFLINRICVDTIKEVIHQIHFIYNNQNIPLKYNLHINNIFRKNFNEFAVSCGLQQECISELMQDNYVDSLSIQDFIGELDSQSGKLEVVVPKYDINITILAENYRFYNRIVNTFNKDIFVGHNGSSIFSDSCKTHTIRENCYYVLGDNRINSSDSRVLGCVPESNIIGKVIKIIKNNHKY